jgi:hypothetical protein
MDRSIGIVWQLEQVFEAYRLMLHVQIFERKKGRINSRRRVSPKKKNTKNKTLYVSYPWMKEYFRYITDQQMHVKIYFIDVHFWFVV